MLCERDLSAAELGKTNVGDDEILVRRVDDYHLISHVFVTPLKARRNWPEIVT